MTLVSVNILTYNRAKLLRKAFLSVQRQSFTDYEVVIGNNCSTDETKSVIDEFAGQGMSIVHLYHNPQLSITANRQSTLDASKGKYIATLDDDDQWCDVDKLKKQVEFLESHPDVVLVGGGIKLIEGLEDLRIERFRPEADREIRKTMLLRNNFFTSTAMFRRDAAIACGGFEFFENDLAEDYYFWLRLGLKGQMYNFQETFTAYQVPHYSREKKKGFIVKQQHLVEKFKDKYLHYHIAKVLLGLRLFKLQLKD